MPTDTLQKPTGQPHELARYTADVGERRIIAQRVNGKLQLRDEPAEGNSRSYVIDAELEDDWPLQDLVDDYLQLAKRKGYIPMHGWY